MPPEPDFISGADASSSVPDAPRELRLDTQNPWPSLRAFTESAGEFFQGRAAEIEELFRNVRSTPLTLLFGVSGLGKTSLLQAGLFPRLYPGGFVPVPIRLNHAADAQEDLVSQVRSAIARALTTSAQPLRFARPPLPTETLWAYFHDRGLNIYAPAAEPAPGDRDDGETASQEAGERRMSLVLVFDQFEEIYTQDRRDDRATTQRREFFDEMATLVENRMPSRLERELARDPRLVRQYDFNDQDYRVILSLREDYLAHVQAFESRIPAKDRTRLRLLRMSEAQALAAVTVPGRAIVEENVAREIVQFVAGQSDTSTRLDGGAAPAASRLGGLIVSPALLSLVCCELNEERKKPPGETHITLQNLDRGKGTILEKFYERCFAGLPETERTVVRTVIEEKLLDSDNVRVNMTMTAASDALVERGLSRERAGAALRHLSEQRLIQFDQREGRPSVELTHDVLTKVTAKSRDERRLAERAAIEENAREAARRDVDQKRALELRKHAERRNKLAIYSIAAVLAMGLLIASCGLLYAVKAQSEAEQQRRIAERHRAEADQQRSETERQRAEAEQQKQQAETNLQQSNRYLADYLKGRVESELGRTPPNGYGALLLWEKALGDPALRIHLRQMDTISLFLATPPLSFAGKLAFDGTPRQVDYSPDGTVLAVLNEKGRLQLLFSGAAAPEDWRPESADASEHIYSFAFAPAPATVLAIRTSETEIRRWDWKTRKHLSQIALSFPAVADPDAAPLLPMVFSPHGDRLAVGTASTLIAVVEAEPGADGTSKLVATARKPIAETTDLIRKSKDTNQAPLGKDANQAHHSNDTNQPARVISAPAMALAFLHEGAVLGSVSADGYWLWDARKLEALPAENGEVFLLEGPPGFAIPHLKGDQSPDAIRPDAILVPWREIAANSQNPVAYPRSVTVSSGAKKADDAPAAPAANPDTEQTSDLSVSIGPLNDTKKEASSVTPPPPRVAAVADSPDGRLRVFGLRTGGLFVGDANGLLQELPHPGAIEHLVWRPDQLVLVSISSDGKARFWTRDPVDRMARYVDYYGYADLAALSPDGHWVANNEASARLYVSDAATGEAAFDLARRGGRVVALAIRNDKTAIGVGRVEKVLSVWEAQGLTTKKRFSFLGDKSAYLALNADGSVLCLAAVGAAPRFFDAMNGAGLENGQGSLEPLSAEAEQVELAEAEEAAANEKTTTSHGDHVSGDIAIAFSHRSGKAALWSIASNDIEIYTVASGARVCSVPSPRPSLSTLAFTADDSGLLCGTQSGDIVLIDAGEIPGEVRFETNRARHSINRILTCEKGDLLALHENATDLTLLRARPLPSVGEIEQRGLLRLTDMTLERTQEPPAGLARVPPPIPDLPEFDRVASLLDQWQAHAGDDPNYQIDLAAADEHGVAPVRDFLGSHPNLPETPEVRAWRQEIRCFDELRQPAESTKVEVVAQRAAKVHEFCDSLEYTLLREAILPHVAPEAPERAQLLYQMASAGAWWWEEAAWKASKPPLAETLLKEIPASLAEARKLGFQFDEESLKPFKSFVDAPQWMPTAELKSRASVEYDRKNEAGYALAERLYRVLIERDGKSTDYCIGLANILNKLDREEEAVAMAQKAAELATPGSEDRSLALANESVYLSTQMEQSSGNARKELLAKTEAKSNESIANLPTYAGAFDLRGDLLRKEKKPKEAVVAYNKAIELEPKNSTYHIDLARVYGDLNDLQKARDELAKATKLGESTASVWADAADALEDFGTDADDTRIIQYYDRAISLDDQADYRCSRANRYRIAGGNDEAREDLEVAIKQAPDDKYIQQRAGWSYFQIGRPETALSCWQRAAELNKNPDADLLAGLAVGNWANGHHPEAIEFYRKLIAKEPKYARADYVRALNWPKGDMAAMEKVRAATMAGAKKAR